MAEIHSIFGGPRGEATDKNKRTADDVLEMAVEQNDLDEIIVIAYRKDRNAEIYTDTNLSDGGDALWMLEMVKMKLLKVDGF